jgi:hypothetical protein
MNKRLLLPALTLLLLPAACGNDDPDSSASVDENTTSAAPTSAESAPEPAPLPLVEHVMSSDGVPGFTSATEAERQDLAAFAAEHDKTVAELRKSGMVAGSALFFEPTGRVEGFGLSVAAEFATEAQAIAEADRLFDANSEPEAGSTVAPLEVPGIPGAQAVTLTGTDGGLTFHGVEIVFADGVVTHELFVMGTAPAVVAADLVAAATALYERVAGRPLA